MTVGKGAASRFNQLVRIERPVADDSADGAGSGSWALVATVYAEVVDMLPSRAERSGDGVTTSSQLSRVRMRWRSDVSPSMRFVAGDRVMQIVSGPAEMGRREAMEFMAEQYRPSGNVA